MQPILVADLFEPLHDELIALLRGLTPDEWNARTVAGDWSVKDIAGHLLDSALRRLSFGRDEHRPNIAFEPNVWNAEWIAAMRRVSPRILLDMLDRYGRESSNYLASIDPNGTATFGVAWAGEETSAAWFDVARELTERWHHQQQTRLAVGAPPLTDPRWSRPVLETFLRALPHRYREVAPPPHTEISLRVRGAETYDFTLLRDAEAWSLWRGVTPAPAAGLDLDEETAWRALTRGMPAEETRRRAAVSGDTELVQPFFHTLAVMA